MSAHDGAARWLSIHDDLLRGLAHAMSNRLATVSAAASLFDARTMPAESVLDALRDEAERLESLLQLLRQLPRREESVLEPMLVSDAVRAALLLQSHHPDFRDVACRLELGGEASPARGEPTAVAHAVCVALVCATRAARAYGVGGIAVQLSCTDDEVVLQIVADRAQAEQEADRPQVADEVERDVARDVAAAMWLLEGSRGHARALHGGCELLLPTLQASRRAAR